MRAAVPGMLGRSPGGRAARAGIAARIACAKRFGCPDGMEKSIECALKKCQHSGRSQTSVGKPARRQKVSSSA
jgi:hypothetical protein